MNDLHSMAAPESAAVPSRPVQEYGSISFLEVLQMLVENLRLLVLLPLVVGLLAFAYTYTMQPTYIAVTRLIPPAQAVGAATSMINSIVGYSVQKNPLDQYVTVAMSDSVRFAVIDRFKLVERYKSKNKEDARDALDSFMRVNVNGKDGVITIEVEDHDPAFAAAVANGNVEELNRVLQRITLSEAQQRRVFFEKQLLIAKANLVKAEQELKASSVGIDVLKTTPGAAVDEVARLKAAITAQELKLASMRGYLAQSAPEFKQALIELSAMRAQLARAEERQPADAKGGGDYTNKYREFKYRESLVELFTRQYETARTDESNDGSVMQVIDPALVPENKSSPKRMLIAVASTVVSVFAVLIFVLLRFLLGNVQEDPEVARKFSNLRKAFIKALGRA